MSDELKPCPFCGSKHVTAYARTCNKDSKYNPADRAFPIVRCRECGACSEGRDWSEPITAITKWNARAESMTAQLESLRAQVTTLTAELARVKALVEGAPVEWRRYKECRTGLIYNDRHSISGEYELIELIARPNLEQKP